MGICGTYQGFDSCLSANTEQPAHEIEYEQKVVGLSIGGGLTGALSSKGRLYVYD